MTALIRAVRPPVVALVCASEGGRESACGHVFLRVEDADAV
jgi:hypothetical protein